MIVGCKKSRKFPNYFYHSTYIRIRIVYSCEHYLLIKRIKIQTNIDTGAIVAAGMEILTHRSGNLVTNTQTNLENTRLSTGSLYSHTR